MAFKVSNSQQQQQPKVGRIFQPASKGQEVSRIQEAERILKEYQNQLAAAKRNADEDSAGTINALIETAKHNLEVAKLESSFDSLNLLRGAQSNNSKLQALEQLNKQLSNFPIAETLELNKGHVNTLLKHLTPTELGKTSHAIYNEALRSLLLIFVLDREPYADEFVISLLPKLRNILKSYEDYPTDILESTVHAYLAFSFYLWVDLPAFETQNEEDLTMLLTLLENKQEVGLNSVVLAAIGVFIFYSKNWNETVEDFMPRLLEVYQYKPVETQVMMSKVIALMFYLYDFSEQHDAPDKSASHRFSIPTVDQGEMTHEFKLTAEKLGQQKKMEELADFNKVQESISICLVPWDSPDVYPDDYKAHEREVYEKTKALAIAGKKGPQHYSWLQDLLYEPTIWVFGGHLPSQFEHNWLVTAAFDSVGSLSIQCSKENMRKGAPRFDHILDPKYLRMEKQEYFQDEWTGRVPHTMYMEFEQDYWMRNQKEKRETVAKEKELRRDRQDKVAANS